MKKYLAIITVFLFVLGFAASAFAVHAEIPAETQAVIAKGSTQITLGGSLRFRGDLKETDFDDQTSPSAKYDARVRLHLNAKVSDTVSGYVELESSNDSDSDTSENWTWGDTSGATGVYAVGNGRRHSLRVLQAWINYNPGPVGIKVGHMPLALGNKIFFNHTKFGDDAIVIYGNPTKQLHLAALTAKFRESSGTKSDDSTGYVALFVYKGGTFNLSGDVTLVDDQATNTHPADNEIHAWNFGLRGDTKVAGLTVRGDVELQTGKMYVDTANELDIKGYAVMLGLDYKMGATKLTLEGGIGSGDDDATDDDFDAFITSLGAHPNAPLYTFVYDYSATGASGGTNAGITNTTYIKLAASTKATKKMGLKGQIVWLKATEDVDLNGGNNPDDELGWEIDGKVTYKLAKNLKYWVEGGYLFVGDAYNDANDEADDAWRLRHGIQLSF
ncbi:MAG TPA: hypothetical protein ENK09_01165 [Nitrospirae bacterium]|nr:hypothetical protein [Nitrospirota bacterium]